jgi:UDP-N-acetylglucosamine 2-epimerase
MARVYRFTTVVGARPQFIKAALISEALRAARNPYLREILVHTGQHYDHGMSGTFFDELRLPAPDYNLGVGSVPRERQLHLIQEKLMPVLTKEKPDMVLVYGDTNSTLAGALSAYRLGIPVAHVEAGLRSGDYAMQEEINRLITDHLSALLFCPTKSSMENLKKEHRQSGRYLVGDIMYELALRGIRASGRPGIRRALGIEDVPYILATVHREANTDDPRTLAEIVRSFLRIPSVIVFPVHPRTKKMLKRFSLWEKLRKAVHIRVIEPVGYADMHELQRHADRIITDSGGVQKEAYFFKIPCLTLRERTEWKETEVGGWNQACAPACEDILTWFNRRQRPGRYVQSFGKGDTSRRICAILQREVSKAHEKKR